VSSAPFVADDRGAVLVMDGATAVGRATAEAFARHGARLVLSGKFDRAERAAMERRLGELGPSQPLFIDADEDQGGPDALFTAIGARCGPVYAVIGSALPVSTPAEIHTIEDYDEGAFVAALRAAAWPLVDYTRAAKRHLGCYPRYVVALTSQPSDRFTPGHDFAACAEAATETLVRYLAYRLRDEGVRVNAVRSQIVRAGRQTVGTVAGIGQSEQATATRPMQDVANAVLALCSGMFDGMTGQVLTVDRGDGFVDGISLAFEREASG